MIERYSRKQMLKIWEPESKFSRWLEIELLVCEAWARLGQIPRRSLATIKGKARFDLKRIDELEVELKHDVIAFLTAVAENVGEDARYIHIGLTSSDLLDTALALQLKEAAEIIESDLSGLLRVLKRKARKYKKTLMIGRTHGIHAEPITFGLKLALWYEEMQRNLVRLRRAKEVISYGKISGAVGTYANVPPSIEKYVCQKLRLKPAPVSSQIIQRDRHAEYFTALAIIASSIEKLALEIRHLQRTEVGEAEEFFSPGQKGSSAMPHKRNPIGSENLSGLARLVRVSALAALENIALWHERDISHSSVERVICPDSTILVDFMLNRITNLIDKLVVYPERMKENLELTRGQIFSQQLLLELARKGASREQAYRFVQRSAGKSKKEDFKQEVLKDKDIRRYLSKEEVEACFDPRYHLRYVDLIFKRVFGNKK
ncbi:MAG: adenylosuccinate lyase [Deltaproteobacteria bacterium]|nr:MAG: adenylosuccinate lyase [Deltaproteobacteria bacterium]